MTKDDTQKKEGISSKFMNIKMEKFFPLVHAC